MTTFWISFEDRATEAWVGTLIIDREDFDLEEVAIKELLAELGAEGLAPIGQFTVDVQRLPATMNIPTSYKNRLITDGAETAEIGGVGQSRYGPN